VSLPGGPELLPTGKPPRAFWANEFWRREPRVFRALVRRDLLTGFNVEKVQSIVASLPHIRIFVSSPICSDPVQRPKFIPGTDAPELLNRLLKSEINYTVLMNQVETVDRDAAIVRALLGVPFTWRRDDIVLTFSTVGSGIGYHAGHEDAFIVQAAGQRRWRIWSAEETSSEARERILIRAPSDVYRFVKSPASPIVDCILNPGDVLYIPPFCPHEGTTTVQSVSIALGWRGVSYFHVLEALAELIALPHSIKNRLPSRFFELLPDVDPALGMQGIDEIIMQVHGRLLDLGCRIDDQDGLAARLRNLMSIGDLAIADY
jgi:ribosomal protein L16 Arg81 hydroxylase